MDMNPQRVRTAAFRTVKKGLDPSEVQAFLHSVADELERAQNQATAMEARARAAVARLQELSDDGAAQGPASTQTAGGATTAADTPSGDTAAGVDVSASVDESETISRTLLLAQRTADTTVAEARAEAERLRLEAEAEARQAGEEERAVVAGEVDSLLARRDFLESDVDHLEQFLVDQRTRLRDAATQIVEIAERVPGGLGEVRRPILSAADDNDDHTANDSADGNADHGADDGADDGDDGVDHGAPDVDATGAGMGDAAGELSADA